MNLQELSAYLQHECYQPALYHVGSGWERCGDSFCLVKADGQFEVFYVERGERGQTFYHGESESAACDALLSVLDRERFSRANCIGLFTEKPKADAIAEQLASAGIRVHRDAIPYSSSTDMRYRIFVFGRDKIRAQQMIGDEMRPTD